MKIDNVEVHYVTGKKNDSFVGVKVKDNIINLYVPESLEIYSDNTEVYRKNILYLLKSISIARKKSDEKSKILSNKYAGHEFPIDSFIWLISDWINSNFNHQKEKKLNIIGKGKINWKETIKHNKLVFPGMTSFETHYFENREVYENDIYKIYNYCVKKSIDFVGWLFNIRTKDFSFPIPNRIDHIIFKNLIIKELNNTYNDSMRQRLIHMKNILIGLTESNDMSLLYGVTNYNYIYEQMVRKVFTNNTDFANFLPQSSWYMESSNYSEEESTNLYMDSVYLIGKTIYIIDSKNYRYGTTYKTKDLPGADSAQKQITYSDVIEKKLESSLYNELYNVYLLPFSNQGNLDKKILKYVGYTRVNWRDNGKSYETIHAVLLDMNYLLNRYFSVFNTESIEMLDNIIKDKLKIGTR